MSIVLDDLPPCAGCGKCCHLLVELDPVVDDVPEALVVEHAGVRCLDQHGDGACVALDPVTRLCSIYERRPQVCRDFKRAESLCRRAVFGRRGSPADESGPSNPREEQAEPACLPPGNGALGSSRPTLKAG